MEILHGLLKSRYPLSPSRLSSLLPFLASFSSSIQPHLLPSPSPSPSPSPFQSPTITRPAFRLFSISSTCLTHFPSSQSKPSSQNVCMPVSVAPDFLIENIVHVITRDVVDLEVGLNSIGEEISIFYAINVVRALNRLGVSAFGFFGWIWKANPPACDDPLLCSLMVDNCGRLGDYQTMLALLKDFGAKKILLTDEAFGFLRLSSCSDEELRCSLQRLVGVFKEAGGGTCCRQGIQSLIRICCDMSCFGIAKFVVDMNNKEAMFHIVLLRECCVKGRFEDARDVLQQMRQTGCDLDARPFNYMISCLWKHGKLDQARMVLEEMIESGITVNACTFEVLICRFCEENEVVRAVQSYQIMVSHGIDPRFSTCAAIIKAYFNSKQYEEAYKYLMDLSVSQKCMINRAYSLLANLHRKHGNLIVAHNLLMEMIGKGLKPDFAVYMNVSKKLYNTKRKDLARILKDKFNSVGQQASNK